MTAPRKIAIVGGGLAGLSLGLALRRADIPCSVDEAGTYPRHRVCGEFITGLDQATIRALGLAEFLRDARPCHEVAWYFGNRPLRRQRLPEPALSLSRHVLDERLAQAFAAAGGELREQSSPDTSAPQPGRVLCTGKKLQAASRWLGLKLHVADLVTECDLEFHLSDGAYVGLSRLPDGRVNVCGLFRRRRVSAGPAVSLLTAYLAACGLTDLTARIAAASPDAATARTVAGLHFASRPRRLPAGVIALGDAYTQIPPFTGNGMAMAFQASAVALPHLVRWASAASADWAATAEAVQQNLAHRFRRRLLVARALHPLLLRATHQRWLAGTQRRGCLPMASLYRLLH